MSVSIGFIGTHDLKLDNKGRLSIPSKFKSVLKKEYGDDGMEVVVRVSLDHTLSVMPASEYTKLRSKIEAFDELDEESRRLQLFFTSLATCEMIDGTGRIRLSEKLKTIAGLAREVTAVGRGSHFEIWDRARWAAHEAATLRDLAQLAEHVRAKSRPQ